MKCTTQPWTVSALYVKQKVIETDPPYQRESGIWSVEKKQLFIDSIMNGFDVPKLYFHDIRSEGEPVSFNVIDGKQRLGAIWEFLDKSKGFSLADDFTFSGDVSWFEEEGPPSPGRKFSELSDKQQEYFRLQAIDVVEVAGADEEDIEELFSRLNNGEPLNAAEKRNAMGGNMIKLVREIAREDDLTDILRFNEKRMSYHEVAAKLLRLELNDLKGQGLFADLKKRFLDSLVKDGRGIPQSEADGLKARVMTNIRAMKKVFGRGHALMNKQSYPQLYFGWLKSLKKDYAFDGFDKKVIDFLEKFHERRLNNLKLPEEDRDPTLVEFGRLMQQGTNDLQSMQERSRILTRYFLQDHPDVEVKDGRRAFSEDERYVIWMRSGKQCQNENCQRDLRDIDEMHADHMKAWARGGKTLLSNAQALCEDCNSKKGAD